MYKKIISVLFVIILVSCSITGCKKDIKEEQPLPSKKDTSILLTDNLDPYVGFGFDNIRVETSNKNEPLKISGTYDREGNYVFSKLPNHTVIAVSKYFVNEIEDYDMLRCNLNNIHSALDIFNNLNYKIEFTLKNNNLIPKDATSNNIFFNQKYYFDYNVNQTKSTSIDGLETAVFEGTVIMSNDNAKYQYPIYGYSIWLKPNPVMLYTINLSPDASLSNTDKERLDSLANSFKAEGLNKNYTEE